MKIGERIRKFRTARDLSQKQLGLMSGMSEPAIRNYELGNRYPGPKQLEKIAGAMGISPLALADPDLDSYHGLMHALFQMEDLYGLRPQRVDGQLVLTFDAEPWDTIPRYLALWNDELQSLRNGNISREVYDLWRYSFPRLQVEREAQERREWRKQGKGIKVKE